MEVLTRKEAAQYLRISIPALDLYSRRGWISRVRIGRRVLFRKEVLDAFVEKCEEKN